MENKKEFFIKIGLTFIILMISVFLIAFYSKNKEEKDIYEDFLEISNTENILKLEDIKNEVKEEVNTDKIKVYITGEVNNPGVKELEEGSRIEDVIILAAGLTEFANINGVNLAYKLEDGQKIYIPNVNEKIEEYITEENGEGIVENSNKALNKININTANIQMFCELPGVGESLASKIISYREENGKFKTIGDLKNVTGIGEKKFESLKEYIVVK